MSNPNRDRADALAAEGEGLASRLLSRDTFPHLVSDCNALAASKIRKKGVTLRTAFHVAQKIKPDILDRMVRELMPAFVTELEPCFSDYRASGAGDLRTYLIAHENQVADAVLSVADRRADRIYSRTIRSAYNRVRGRARREILAAVPDIAATIAKHAEASERRRHAEPGGASVAGAT